MDPEETEAMNDSAGESQQQFKWPTDELVVRQLPAGSDKSTEAEAYPFLGAVT
jgi:hypothetical protein